jgi:hypothetical protein
MDLPPVAHAGHVIVDVILILGPLLALAIALLVANVRARRDPGDEGDAG